MSDWQKVQSKSKPGCVYYFCIKTGKSQWNRPDELRDSKAVTSETEFGMRKPSVPTTALLALSSQQQSNPPVGQHADTAVTSPVTPGPKQVGFYRTSSGTSTGSEEAMECVERWAEDEEVQMDMDVDLGLIIDTVHSTRELLPFSLPSPSSLEGFGIHQQHSDAVSYTELLYLVLDTNILLSHLKFLEDLKDYAIKGVGRPVLVLPWVVLQELDSLKSAKESSVQRNASSAIRFLHSCFSRSHPRVHGQTVEEVNTEVNNLAISNNDDRILHCCLVYQAKLKGQGTVVLFSNDVQLCNKALVNGVKAVDRKTLLSELREICKDPHAVPTAYSHTPEFSVRVGQTAMMDDLLCEAERIMKSALSTAVEYEMLAAYDADRWIQIVAIKPPWSLKNLMFLLNKHWLAVFSLLLHKKAREVREELNTHVMKRHRMIPVFQDMKGFVENSKLLLKLFQEHLINPSESFCNHEGNIQSYRDTLKHSITAMEVLLQKAQEVEGGRKSVLPSCSPVDSSVQPVVPVGPSLQQSLSMTLQSPLAPPGTPADARYAPVRLLLSTTPLPPNALEWVLQLIHESSKYFYSQIVETLTKPTILPLERHSATTMLQKLYQLLEQVTTSLCNILNMNGSVQELYETSNRYLVELVGVSSPIDQQVLQLLIEQLPVCSLLSDALDTYRGILKSLSSLSQ